MARSQCWLSMKEYHYYAALKHFKDLDTHSIFFEKIDRVGGRIRTDEIQGFLLDREFQALQTAYPEPQSQLDYSRLNKLVKIKYFPTISTLTSFTLAQKSKLNLTFE
ncbi:FAD-dependent oxidoreductase [Planctomicrobium sp.]|nr:FAD-dependent oxidoreductase [Planctomicrobium sp.]